MATLAAVGDALVGLDELDRAASAPELRDFFASSFDPSFELLVSGTRAFTGTTLKRSHDAQSVAEPFQGVGVGKPLTLMLEQVYLGDYPDTLRWVPGGTAATS